MTDLIGCAIADGYWPAPTINALGQFSHDVRSAVQLWNPAGSGVNFFLTGGSYAWATFQAWLNAPGVFYNGHGVDLCFSESPFGEVQRYLRFANPALRGSASEIELRVSQTPGVDLPDSPHLFKELWAKQSGEDTPFNLGKAIEIPPCSGVIFRPAQPSVYCIINIAGHMVPAL